MDATVLTCPEFLSMERSIIEDFVACVRESCEEAEACIKFLNQENNPEYVNRLFRSLHSMKGNCQMVGLTPFTEPLHRIEDIVVRVRSKQIPYQPEIGDYLLYVTDQIQDLLAELINTKQTSNERRLQLCQISEEILANLTPNNVAEQFKHALNQFGSKADEDENKVKKIVLSVPDDLVLMRNLAIHIDNLSIYWKDRSDKVASMLALLNEALGNPIDAQQLQAAAWMHDVGMSFIPHNILNKEGSLSKQEIKKIQEHVIISSQLLLRFRGWDEAAQMVLDHHERFDGSGYPNGAKGDEIHLGGRMLSIIDTYCSITTERSDRTFKKSILSAISEINANSDTQFDPAIVSVFNEVVRKILMKATSQ